MKISILFTDGAKQIIMTPENEYEKSALRMIGPDDTLGVVSRKLGSFGNDYDKAHYSIAGCRGGYYRPFEDKESLMFVIQDKVPTEEEKINKLMGVE